VKPIGMPLLRLLARLYGGVVSVRNRYYDRPGNVRRAPLPVISVGNITVGGTGKTPLVVWLARCLLSSGRRPVIVSRGYGGTAGRGPVFVSRGGGALCGPEVAGDEPYLMASTLAQVSVVVGSDRWAGASAAAAQGCDIAVLDDGFQHRGLARDLDLVLIDSNDPFDDHRLLPAGRLREPLGALRRADLVLITRSRADERHPDLERQIREYAPSAPVLSAGHRTVGFFDAEGRGVEGPVRALGFCGVGSPAKFHDDLREEAAEVVAFRAFRDHHVYTPDELRSLRELARSHGARLVTTEKDLARLRDRATPLAASELLSLRIEAVVHRPDPLLEALRRLEGAP
jgi:tetraacyldisaccharide 4'-kinase